MGTYQTRYSISVETKRPLVNVSDQSATKQLRRNYNAMRKNAFNAGRNSRVVRARPGRQTRVVFTSWTTNRAGTLSVMQRGAPSPTHTWLTLVGSRASVASTQREMHLPEEGDAIFSGTAFVQSATRSLLSLLLSELAGT